MTRYCLFSASDSYAWNHPKQPYMQGHVDEHFEKDDIGYKTAYYGNVLTGSNTRNGESGKPWKGIDPTAKGRHWAIPGKLWEDSGLDDTGLTQHQKLDALFDAGMIEIAEGHAWPIYERRIRPGEGPATGDIWAYQPYTEGTVFGSKAGIDADVSWIKRRAIERIGYPTQKPVGLLDRIIRASSNEGDVILDPFCGCGTTVEAAERAKRQWIGIDIAVHAIKVIEARLGARFDDPVPYDMEGMPRDFESALKLAERDKYQFQWWANYLFNPHALREQKKGADRGIDGELFFPNGPGRPWGRMLTSVKGGEHVSPNDVRAFAQVLNREGAQLGLFICLRSPTREMIRDAAAVGLADIVHGDIPKLQIVAIEEWFKGKMPLLPPLEHLPSAAFAGRRRPTARAPRPDLKQPELPFSFVGGREENGVVRHFNPRMVEGVA